MTYFQINTELSQTRNIFSVRPTAHRRLTLSAQGPILDVRICRLKSIPAMKDL